MEILRESFETTMQAIENELNRKKYTELENENDNLSFTQQYMFENYEDLTDTINLEDELANLPISLMTKGNNEIKLAGQKVVFKKSGKTLKPFLGDIEIKGRLKQKVIYAVIDFTKMKPVRLNGKPFLKYNFQYGIASIDFYTDNLKTLSGFFKQRLTSVHSKSYLRAIDVDRYAYREETNEEIEILKEENEMLKDEIERLKSLLQ